MQKRHAAVAVLAILVLSSTGAAAGPVAAPSYDGATLLAGVFFGEGPVAALLPEITTKADADTSRSAVEYIAEQHPGFLDALPSSLQSGDPIVIREALQKAHSVMAEHAAVSPNRVEDPPMEGTVVNIATVLNVAVLVNFAMAVNVYVGGQIVQEIVWTNDFPRAPGPQDPSRLRDD